MMNPYESGDNLTKLIMSETKSTDEITLCYYLYNSRIDSESRDAFGVKITSLFNGESDCSFFDDITSDGERALEIFKILADNLVTPCTLSEILEDIL